jgi:nitrogen fixation protein NifB
VKFVGHRRVDNYCQGGFGEEESLETVVRAINDCAAVFISRIGNCPREGLLKAGIVPVDRFALEYIEQSALTYFREYLERVQSGEIEHKKRGDADIRQGALIAT